MVGDANCHSTKLVQCWFIRVACRHRHQISSRAPLGGRTYDSCHKIISTVPLPATSPASGSSSADRSEGWEVPVRQSHRAHGTTTGGTQHPNPAPMIRRRRPGLQPSNTLEFTCHLRLEPNSSCGLEPTSYPAVASACVRTRTRG
jgi:hypothetical protein